MDTQPTQEQVQKFWEWCGFKRLPEGRSGYHFEHGQKVMNWMPPGAKDDLSTWQSLDYTPPIDLNNLFKYAVPIVLYKLEERGFKYALGVLFDQWQRRYQEHKDFDTALFWAIWEVISHE